MCIYRYPLDISARIGSLSLLCRAPTSIFGCIYETGNTTPCHGHASALGGNPTPPSSRTGGSRHIYRTTCWPYICYSNLLSDDTNPTSFFVTNLSMHLSHHFWLLFSVLTPLSQRPPFYSLSPPRPISRTPRICLLPLLVCGRERISRARVIPPRF